MPLMYGNPAFHNGQMKARFNMKISLLMITLSVAISGLISCTNFADMTPAELAEYDNSWWDGASEITAGTPYMPTWEAEYKLSDYEITSTCHTTRFKARMACLNMIGKWKSACTEYTRVPAVAEIHFICGDTLNELHELSHITHEYNDS
jgi:hypothetical protein